MNELIALIQKEFPGFKGAVIFTEKDGKSLANPLFEHNEKTQVQDLVDALREWSRACDWMARDIATKMQLKNRKN